MRQLSDIFRDMSREYGLQAVYAARMEKLGGFGKEDEAKFRAGVLTVNGLHDELHRRVAEEKSRQGIRTA